MLDLTSHLLLTSDGWEHVSNMSSHDEADSVKRQLELIPDAYEYQIGQPKGGAKYTSEALTSMGFVGLYRRGGRTVPCIVSQTPSLPIFSDDTPIKPSKPPKQGIGGPYDRPPSPVFAGSEYLHRYKLSLRMPRR